MNGVLHRAKYGTVTGRCHVNDSLPATWSLGSGKTIKLPQMSTPGDR